MGKVVTSEGLTEFVQSGKFTHVPNHKPGGNGAAPPLETVKPAATVDVKPAEGEKPAEAKPAEKPSEVAKAPETENELTPEEQALPEKYRKELLRKNKAVNQKHREMMEAKEAAAESDRLAENQYNERRLAQQRAEALEVENRELKAKIEPPKPELKEPDIADYKLADGNYDWLKFQKDTSAYTRQQALADFRKEEAEKRSQQEMEAAKLRLGKQADEARKKHADFDTVMANIKDTDADKVPRFVLDFIQESENSAEVAYHLAKNPEVAQRISKLKPILGIAELGKLEAALVQPPSATAKPAAESVTTRTNGGAPAPIIPLDGEGTGGLQTDPSKMTYKELRAYHKAQEAERRKH